MLKCKAFACETSLQKTATALESRARLSVDISATVMTLYIGVIATGSLAQMDEFDEKLTASQLVNYSRLYVSRYVITAFTRARDWNLFHTR
jgi:hypothetical protein